MFLETAHPVKFYDVVEPVIGEKVPVPHIIEKMLGLHKESIKMKAQYEELKEFLVS